MSRTSGASDLVELKVKILGNSPKAIRVKNLKDESVWLPCSQVEDNGDGTITLPEWLATEKELI